MDLGDPSKFSKKKALRNEKNLERIRKEPCIACSLKGPNDPDHLRTRGAGGGDELSNLIPLCRLCHIERHRIGLRSFANRYNLPISWESGFATRTDLE